MSFLAFSVACVFFVFVFFMKISKKKNDRMIEILFLPSFSGF